MNSIQQLDNGSRCLQMREIIHTCHCIVVGFGHEDIRRHGKWFGECTWVKSRDGVGEWVGTACTWDPPSVGGWHH